MDLSFTKGSLLPGDQISQERLHHSRVQFSIRTTSIHGLQWFGSGWWVGCEMPGSRTIQDILHGKHPITKLIISSEHTRLLHAGPTLVMASLCRHYHIVGCRKAIRSITRKCIICRRTTVKPQSQLLGQLPSERVTPGSVLENVGVDYAGPFYIKYGSVRKPTIIKAFVCVFVSLSVHLESVSDLTTDATLRRFIARRGKTLPHLERSRNKFRWRCSRAEGAS